MSRRSALGAAVFAALTYLGIHLRPRYQVGDLIRIVFGPRRIWDSYPDMRNYYDLCEACVGRTLRVIYVGDDGRPEVNVPDDIAVGWSISLERDWVLPG